MSTKRAETGTDRRGRRIVATLVLVGLVYANVSSIIESPRIPFHPPRTWYVKHLFRMFSLFSHTTKFVYGFEARARVAGTGPGEGEWILLNPYLFFPQGGGEPNRRMNLHSFPRGTPPRDARRHKTYQEMVARMKVLYARWHPDEPIDRIQLYYMSWPKSPDGYRARIAEAEKYLIIDE